MICEIHRGKREINQRVQKFGPILKNQNFKIIFWFWSSAHLHQWLILLFLFIDWLQERLDLDNFIIQALTFHILLFLVL